MLKTALIILRILLHLPSTILVVHNIINVKICLKEVSKVFLTYISRTIVLVNVSRTIRILRNNMILSILYSYPASTTILINYLYFRLITIITCFFTKEEYKLRCHLNTITYCRISSSNEIQTDIRNLLTIRLLSTNIFWILIKSTIINTLKFRLSKIYTKNI